MPTRVPKGKVLLSVAIDPELREAARAAAEKEEVTLTVFVTRALRERLAESSTGGAKRVARTPRRGR
jgi:predicted HicB family RNase H-like nuclease